MLVKEDNAISEIVSLYDAKTHLSSLVDRAADGEEIVIAKNGVPLAKAGAGPAPRPQASPRQGSPFDRMLVAQSMAQGLVLVHADPRIREYRGASQLWAG